MVRQRGANEEKKKINDKKINNFTNRKTKIIKLTIEIDNGYIHCCPRLVFKVIPPILYLLFPFLFPF